MGHCLDIENDRLGTFFIKFISLKVRLQLESKRKQALDEHLNFIVDKTEKFSNLLAESLQQESGGASLKTTPAGSDRESVSSGRSGPVVDKEYRYGKLESMD